MPEYAKSVAPSDAYVRPGWTGLPFRYSDGQLDHARSQCASCLSYHHARYGSCNGKREFSDRQCEAVLGEIQCHRPSNHLGGHAAKSAVMRVEWEQLIDGGGADA